MTWKDNPTSANVFVVVGAILSVWNLADFIFYGRHIHDLLGGVGFGLWAYGTYRNGNRKPPQTSDSTFNRAGYYASVAGLILVVLSIGMRFWP